MANTGVVFSSDSHTEVTPGSLRYILKWLQSNLEIFWTYAWIHQNPFWNDSPYFEMTPPTTVNRIQGNMVLYRVINWNHIYVDIDVDF